MNDEKKMTRFAEGLMQYAFEMSDESAERSELVATSVGFRAYKEGWTEEELKRWFQTGYGKVFVRMQNLDPGLDLKDLQKISYKAYKHGAMRYR